MGTCKDCKHFNIKPMKPDRGSCDLTGDYNKVIDGQYADKDSTETFCNDKAYGLDFENYKAQVIVGINFGCIHFEKNA